ncbi:hypothetical protein FMA36_06985 [Komagataeibacter xylinus]|uniref:Uncharacterized protein n=2 Tax=Komagataeibacter xylinus TaxID=28448 RepID=A0A857FM39_KOMXY|nr:hypothetical protein FMA36_06985 [Komagataeibacter xylinus]
MDANLSKPVAALGIADQFLCAGREHAGTCSFLIIGLAVGYNLNPVDVLPNNVILACCGGKETKKHHLRIIVSKYFRINEKSVFYAV